nr:FeoB-associated Cys-rich membrane protein [Capnocytophaga catalasegens]
MQEFIVYTALAVAVVFLLRKIFFTKKNKCGNGNCKCG